MIKNTIEGYYIFMNDFVILCTKHGPNVYKLEEGHLNARNGQNTTEDATSLYCCLLASVKKINKY